APARVAAGGASPPGRAEGAPGRRRGAAARGRVGRKRAAAPLPRGHLVRLGAPQGRARVPARAHCRADDDAGRGRRRVRRGGALLMAMAAMTSASGAACADELVPVAAPRWQVTKGSVAALNGVRVRVSEPKMRAVAPDSDGNAAELRFVYQGPTSETTALASGEVRRQLGLKLRAQNGCNLLYVMWR